MKQTLLFTGLLILLSPILLLAENSQIENNITQDSLSYQSQRQRVNDLLDQRTERFGEYSESLKRKTGIFGLFKRKSDMQQSIDILREIVLNDNNIFVETRKLLDLKDAQSTRYQHLAGEFDQQISAYMKTITKLQNENENLRNQISQMESTDRGSTIFSYFSAVAILVLLGVIVVQQRKLKLKNWRYTDKNASLYWYFWKNNENLIHGQTEIE